MRVIPTAAELNAHGRKVCVAIGMFDGVHLGHQQVIRQTIEDARQHEGIAVAITFDRHPNSVVAPDHNPPLIYSLSQKLRVIESLGIEIPACLFACYIYEAQLFDERTLNIVAEGLQAWRELLRPKFEAAIRHCEPQRIASADELADLLLATIEGGMILGRSHRDATILPRQLRQYRNYLELLFARWIPAAAPGLVAVAAEK